MSTTGQTKTGAIWNQWSQNRRLFFAIIAIGITSYLWANIFHMPLKVSVVLVAQIFLYILLFFRPVWALASLIVGQLTLSTYMFPLAGQMISVRLFWSILTVLLLIPILTRKGGIQLGTHAKRIILPTMVFFTIAAISNVVNTDLSNTAQYLRTNITAAIVIILLPAVINNEKDIKRLAIVALVICSASAIYAIRQTIMHGGRVGGLTGSAVYQGFDIPIVLLPTLAIFAIKGATSNVRKILLLLVLVMAVALYYTYTRTGIYSLIPGVLLMGFFLKGKSRKVIIIILVVLSILFIGMMQASGSRYSQGFGDDSSSTARLVLWQAALKIALDNPLLGIGDSKFKTMSQAYTSTISPNTQGAVGALGSYEAHNDFFAVWTSFGTVALIAYLFIFIGMFRNFFISQKKAQTRFLKGFAIGCICALVAYIVNAATHNVMSSSMLLWILAGFSIATTKIVTSKQVLEVEVAK